MARKAKKKMHRMPPLSFVDKLIYWLIMALLIATYFALPMGVFLLRDRIAYQDATVVAKRADVSRHHHNGVNDHHHYHNSTSYYVTFQVESGDRMELHMAGHEYGLLIEGDKGKLTFQGTRFLNFQRV